MSVRSVAVAVLVVVLVGLFSGEARAAALMKAAKRGDLSRVTELVDSGKVELDERDWRGNTAIYYAALEGHADVVRFLAVAGADVDVDNRFGSTPLHVASRAGHLDVIRVLAESGANLDTRNLSGGTASELAAGAAADLQRETLQSASPLSKAAGAGQIEAVKLLVDLGASLPARDAVEQAQLRGHPEIAAFLTRATNERRVRERAGGLGAPALGKMEAAREGTTRYERRVAAVIGVSRYSRMNDLEGAHADARGVAEMLRSLGFDEVLELYDEKASRAAILELVGQELREKTTPRDLAFVYFAGHGATESLPDGEKRGYLIPTEGAVQDAYVSGISMETLRDLSNRLAARHVYYAIDACYSGSILVAPTGLAGSWADSSKRSVQILTAGTEGQLAAESDGRGVFTTYLLQGLGGEANLNGDSVVTATEVGQFVANQVALVTGGKQTPAFGRLAGTGEVTFAVRTREESP